MAKALLREFYIASAGTGKTEKIQQLVIERILGDPRPVGDVLDATLIVSFTRAAAGELRTRTQRTIQHALRAMAGNESWRNTDLEAAVTSALGSVAQKNDRLLAAQAAIDELWIGTIHALCKRLINLYPVESGARPGLVISSDTSEIEAEAMADAFEELSYEYSAANDWAAVFGVDDPYVRDNPDLARPKPGKLQKLAERAMASNLPLARPAPGTLLKPSTGASLATAADRNIVFRNIRDWFANKVRERLESRKAGLGVIDLNDLVGVIDQAFILGGSPLATRVHDRWDLIILDEAQDTDAAQWRILERLAGPNGRLVAVGDPKQSIYSFRGAHYATIPPVINPTCWASSTLPTNYRSDTPLVHALNALFWALPGFTAAVPHRPNRIEDHSGPTPEPRSGLYLHVAQRPAAGPHSIGVAIDGTAEAIVLELNEGLVVLDDTVTPAILRPLEPRDIAVVVRKNAAVERMRAALVERGVPVAAVSDVSVLESDELRELAAVFAAMARPSDQGRRGAVAMTRIVGFDNVRLGAMMRPDPASADGLSGDARNVMVRLGELREVLLLDGVGAAIDAILDEPWLQGEEAPRPRILRERDGERAMKNLLDLAAILVEQFWSRSAGTVQPEAIAQWLLAAAERSATRELDEGEGGEMRVSLETDADAVQVMTIHTAKGREFRSVWIPEACRELPEKPFQDDGQPWPEVKGGQLVLETSPADMNTAKNDARMAAHDEERRMLYVAATRGMHRTHLVVGCFGNLKPLLKSGKPSQAKDAIIPMASFLYGPPRPPAKGGTVLERFSALAAHSPPPPFPNYLAPEQAGTLASRLNSLKSRASGQGGVVEILDLPLGSRTDWRPPVPPAVPNSFQAFGVPMPKAMRLTSFSSLASLASVADGYSRREAAQHEHADEEAAGRPNDEDLADEADVTQPAKGPADPRQLAIPTDAVRGGKETGDFVHKVLEVVLTAPTPADPTTLSNAIDAVADRIGLPASAPLRSTLAVPLGAAITQPLDGWFGNLSLADLSTAGKVAAETPFTAALDLESIVAKTRDLRDVFRKHGTGDFAGFHERLATLDAVDVRGLFTGLWDLVWVSPDGRVAIIDHKMNVLRLDEGGVCMGAYARPCLIEALGQARYLLQAALYGTLADAHMRALDPGWDYERFLGVSFTFLRAMGHSGAAAGTGVAHITVPHGLVVGLADALGIGARSAGTTAKAATP
jgi:exodeoxyribonuclease V beta subunit